MPNFSSHLQWFQAKIGSYDKQSWETSVEQRILQGLENRPKREGSLHKELIDIDLVRGSTFSKAKPRHGLKSVIINGLKRVIFFPIYYSHWRTHLTKEIVHFCLFHYTIQMLQLVLYAMWSHSSEIMVEEIFLPLVLSLGLGVLHAHIVAPGSVKQRRKKTLSNTVNTGKQTSKTELSPGLSSRKASQQTTDVFVNQSHTNFPFNTDVKIENTQSRLDNPSHRSKKKQINFGVSRSRSIQNEDEYGSSEGKKRTNVQVDYSETETKDSSSSENEHESPSKMIANDDAIEGNNDPICTEALCNSKKHVKISDNSDRMLIGVSRQLSQPFQTTEVPNKDSLKKFLCAKYKQIPDPIPVKNLKKEKDKEKVPTWKPTSYSLSSKPSSAYKSRRANSEWVGSNSNPSSDNTKVQKSSVGNMTNISPIDGTNSDGCTVNKFSSPIENAINEDEVLLKVKSEKETCKVENPSLSETSELASDSKEYNGILAPSQSASQPHTPLNHYASKHKYRIDVRKVSSADASPTPSRKNSTCFSTPVDLNREHLNSTKLNNEKNIVTNHSLSNSSQDQGSNHSVNENAMRRVVVDNSISSEDVYSKMIDLNEDTITKSHKKREEYKQLFEFKAQSNIKQEKKTHNSSSSSSRKSSSEISKHNKMKRRYRDDHKSSTENYHSKHRKEVVQSMSETEYDRMNSDVNSTGNSTSDGEDICSNVNGNKVESKEKEVIDQNAESNHFSDLLNNQINGMNDNNPSLEEYKNNPILPSENNPVEDLNEDPFLMWYKEIHTSGPITGVNETVSCYIWEDDNIKKTNLSLLDIGWSIIQAVERHEHDKSYSRFGFFIMIILCFTPIFFRVYVNWNYLSKILEMARHTQLVDFLLPQNGSLMKYLISQGSDSSVAVQRADFNLSKYRSYNWSDDIIPLTLTSVIGSEWPIRLIVIFGVISRIILYSMTFLMLCVAENSFEQRLQYAKHFCRLTSTRRARKYYLPHFRLNKLANITCWLTLRSYLKKRGPQRSVESIISSAFYMLLAMLSLVCVNLLQNGNTSFINKLINWDLTLCSLALGIFMMRFLVLGTKISKKYRNLSVIITEQINLFLAMQTRPHKKEELTLAHNVLRLAESLLKEVEGPFRVCGWSMNPFLYNILKVVILSVFSTILSETCGFKMKLYKIKINPANW